MDDRRNYYFTNAEKRALAKTPAIEVARMLGLNVVNRGNRFEMLCPNPEHNDKRLGSCRFSPDGQFCSCYACAEDNGKPLQITPMRMLGWAGYDWLDSYIFLAEQKGELENYKKKRGRGQRVKPLKLSDEEKVLIGLSDKPGVIMTPAGLVDDKVKRTGNFVYNEELDQYIRYDYADYHPWQELKADKEAYAALVKGKCEERILALAAIAEDPEPHHLTRGDIREVAQQIIKIYTRFGGNPRVKVSEIVSRMIRAIA